MNLKGCTAIIIGATGGIGREFSLALAKNGINLIIVGRKLDSLEVLEKELNTFRIDVDKYTCDLANPRSIEELGKKVQSKYEKGIDFLFHIAGIGIYKKLPDITYADWKSSMDINVTSVYYITKNLLPMLLKSKNSYVIVSGSGMGKVAVGGRASYCASKFALRGLILSLAKEYKGTNIHFVHLTLGSVLTSFGPLSIKEKQRKSRQGKGYLDPTWLANNIVTRLGNGTLDTETPVYPRHYFVESRRGKT